MIQEPVLVSAELTVEDFRREVLAGLSRPSKTLPCKYLYDEQGARLFEAICEVEEYYPTRTELAILRWNMREMATMFGPRCRVVELGSGSAIKTRLLLEHMEDPAVYVPIDVSRNQLFESAARFAKAHPALEVLPVCADYTNHFELPESPVNPQKTILFFPGSTIGNFEPREAAEFMGRTSRFCGRNGGILLGVDLKKEPALLHRAYNDSRGITAEFNLNLLDRINRELDGDFDRSLFRHQARYNDAAGRIEMHLVNRQRQTVTVSGRQFHFTTGESIVTEHSYKYTLDEFRRLMARAGLQVARCWTDDQNWFSVQYLVPR